MSNSPLVNYVKISSHKNSPRNTAIKKITIHHMAGNLSVETCGAVFTGTREVSANYGIGSDGRVGLYVDESDRAWTSSSPSNDHQAVTIEVANDQMGGNWHVSDAALSKLIDLCTDICKRNGIRSLNYTGDVSGNLTMHCWFKNTDCPGPYLKSKFPYIADEVNKRLAPTAISYPSNTSSLNDISVGEIVTFKGGYHYSSATSASPVGHRLLEGPAKVTAIYSKGNHPIHLVHTDNKSCVYGWCDLSDISKISVASAPSLKSIDTIAQEVLAGNWGNGDDRRKRLEEAGYNYTTVQEAVNAKLSGKTTTTPDPVSTFEKGDKVKVKAGATYYKGAAVPSWIIKDTWIVYQDQKADSDRVVINKNTAGNNAIMSPISAKYLYKV